MHGGLAGVGSASSGQGYSPPPPDLLGLNYGGAAPTSAWVDMVKVGLEKLFRQPEDPEINRLLDTLLTRLDTWSKSEEDRWRQEGLIFNAISALRRAMLEEKCHDLAKQLRSLREVFVCYYCG